MNVTAKEAIAHPNETQIRRQKRISRAFATGHSMCPVRGVSTTFVDKKSQPLNDVSPWPQADCANPTRGELAELLKGPWKAHQNARNPPKPNAVKDLHSNICFCSSSKKGTISKTMPVPSA
ncbi:MAG: hypothetical protein CMM01_11970 [Rhodopirellula sp.]|nr:hypothetical protein [Rhodopirellula sp.]OUX51117.1 MAG: hypothetical protein CBE43_04780 [Rhodopirellula sp. TMED283]